MTLPKAETFSMQATYTHAVVILEMKGDVTMQARALLSGFRDGAQGLEVEERALILDFHHVSSSSSGGIAVLMRLTRERAEGHRLTFMCGLSAYLERLFHIVGLTQYAMIYPDEYSIMQRLKEAE